MTDKVIGRANKKLYDKIKQLLEDYPELRNSDKKLIWKFWEDTGCIDRYSKTINYDLFMLTNSPMAISRTARLVRQKNKHLRADKRTQAFKDKKEATKGYFVFHEIIQEELI